MCRATAFTFMPLSVLDAPGVVLGRCPRRLLSGLASLTILGGAQLVPITFQYPVNDDLASILDARTEHGNAEVRPPTTCAPALPGHSWRARRICPPRPASPVLHRTNRSRVTAGERASTVADEGACAAQLHRVPHAARLPASTTLQAESRSAPTPPAWAACGPLCP